eukprot:SAG31_NODE_9081_length_1338_cov_1.680387_2_plen_95_part_00
MNIFLRWILAPWLGYADQIQRFESSSAAAYFVINLWRPVLPMVGSEKSTPLAILHPMALVYKDFAKVELVGGQFPEGQASACSLSPRASMVLLS